MGLLLLPAIAIAQDAEPGAAVRFEGQINGANEMAGNLKAELKRISDEVTALQKEGAVTEDAVTDDLAKAKEYWDGLIAKFDQAAAAWTKGDEAEAKKLNEEGHAGLRKKDIFHQRMFEFRRAQVNAAPKDDWYKEQAANTKETAMPALDAVVKRREAAAEAWAVVAQAAVPDVDRKALIDLKDKAFAAGGEAEIALMQYYWANQLAGMLESDKSITKDDIKDSLEKLTKAQEELIAARRKQIEIERDIRNGHVDVSKANEEVHKTFWKTREEKARAAAAAAGQ
jgi:hypothetical protein